MSGYLLPDGSFIVLNADPSPEWLAGLPEGTVVTDSERPGPGYQWVDGAWVAPAPDPVLARGAMQLTRRQVIIGMTLAGLITHQEAIAMAKDGTAPAAIETMLATMPEPQQTAARITLASFTMAYRLDPMVALFQTAGGLTDAQMDAFFAENANI